MDQLRNILGLLKKHHFWLLAVICMISGLVGWSMASKSLSAAYTQKKGTIESAFKGLKSITATDPFPNTKWKEGIAQLTKQEREQVKQAWEQLYTAQREILEWPGALGPEFLKAIATIAPGSDIPPMYCKLYATNIQGYIPELLGIIGATPEVAADAAAKAPPPKGRADDGAPKVVWSDQQQVQDLLKFKEQPKPAEVWLAQEDLWVYKSLLTVINTINGESYVLKIPRIDSLKIGKSAAAALELGMGPGHIKLAEQASSSSDASGQAPVAPAPVPDAESVPALDEGRYVDAAGKALAAGGAAKSEFKRMPVYMKLSIDEREIPKLLAEYANSPLPLEVRQLRINSGKGATKSDNTADRGGAAAEAEMHTVPLELGGIIYIYNKPDPSKLGGEQTAVAADATAPPQAAPAVGAPGG